MFRSGTWGREQKRTKERKEKEGKRKWEELPEEAEGDGACYYTEYLACLTPLPPSPSPLEPPEELEGPQDVGMNSSEIRRASGRILKIAIYRDYKIMGRE